MKLTNYTKILSHALLWGIVLIVPSYTMSRGTTQDYSPHVDFSTRAVVLIILFYVNYLCT